MSFLEAFRIVALCSLVITLVFGFVMFSSSDDDEQAFWFTIAFFIFMILGSLLYIWGGRCPRCRKWACYGEYKTEDLSRETFSKRVRDEKVGVQIEHYAIGKRKHYKRCSVCKYESTHIRDYKDKINV